MIQEWPDAALTRLSGALISPAGPPIAPPWKNETERFWRLLEGPACARLPLGWTSILGQCSRSAALSLRQAASSSSPPADQGGSRRPRRFRTIQDCPKSVARKHIQALALSNAHIPLLWQQKAFSGSVKTGAA
jgi:hypothetical protein